MNVFLMWSRQQRGRDRTLDTRDEQKSRENKIIFFPPPTTGVGWKASVLLHLESWIFQQNIFLLRIFIVALLCFATADEFCIPRGVSFPWKYKPDKYFSDTLYLVWSCWVNLLLYLTLGGARCPLTTFMATCRGLSRVLDTEVTWVTLDTCEEASPPGRALVSSWRIAVNIGPRRVLRVVKVMSRWRYVDWPRAPQPRE